MSQPSARRRMTSGVDGTLTLSPNRRANLSRNGIATTRGVSMAAQVLLIGVSPTKWSWLTQ